MVERYVEGTSADWQFSEDTYGTFYLRDMSNPFYAQQPHTRGGTYWLTSQGCPGIFTEWYCTELVPYTNMGVQNYWFYLLSQGGVHNGVTVGSIGADKAARIAYYTMCYYFNGNSLYDDVRYGSIESARTLYGQCSYEYYQVQNAWAAVGVGSTASPCMDVQIGGYDYLQCGEQGYYYANISGGSGNYSYQWYVDYYLYSTDPYIYVGWYPQYSSETHYISLSVSDGSLYDSDDLSVYVQNCGGIQDKAAQSENNTESIKLNVYPNPATDEITVSLNKEQQNGLLENYSVRIIDMQGTTVYQNIITTYENLRIDISKLKTGNYHIILSNKNSNNVVLTNQFLKK